MTWPCPGGSREGRILGPGVAAILLLVLAVSCDSTTPSSSYGPLPPAVTSAALQPTIEQGAVDLYLAGVKAEETLQAVRALETATAVAGRATATAQAQAIIATRAAWEAEATRSAWAATATAAPVQATATAQAQAAAATATATAWSATATTEAIAWSQAATATRSAWEVGATATRTAWEAVATAQAAQAERARLEAERARLTHPVRAYGPWALLLTTSAVILWAGVRFARALEIRARTIPDASGDVRALVVPGPKGGLAVVFPQRSLGPVITIDSQEVSQPPLAPLEAQERVTSRQQAVEALKAIDGAPNRRKAARALTQMMTQNQPPTVRIIPPEAIRSALRELRTQALILSADEKGDQ
ncbi:MAG: hypothetical protein RML46_10840 [Anaerolineae bacterium]|nr:hypothetical protein [Anaerolineae bacterium]